MNGIHKSWNVQFVNLQYDIKILYVSLKCKAVKLCTLDIHGILMQTFKIITFCIKAFQQLFGFFLNRTEESEVGRKIWAQKKNTYVF